MKGNYEKPCMYKKGNLAFVSRWLGIPSVIASRTEKIEMNDRANVDRRDLHQEMHGMTGEWHSSRWVSP
jgi:hypothetical protein